MVYLVTERSSQKAVTLNGYSVAVAVMRRYCHALRAGHSAMRRARSDGAFKDILRFFLVLFIIKIIKLFLSVIGK